MGMREALKESEDFYFSERHPMVDTLSNRAVYRSAFEAGANWQAALQSQAVMGSGAEPVLTDQQLACKRFVEQGKGRSF